MHGTRTIYDFDRLRILRINLADKNYTNNSLYSDIGFRAVEFQNRIMLGAAARRQSRRQSDGTGVDGAFVFIVEPERAIQH
jgi:hypothetical protein